jgi:large subunit ribosomal protein L10e
MARKPNRMYREIRGQAYTRKEYIGGVPANRIVDYDLGDPNGEYTHELHLITEEQCQIRHIALEAARITANRYMSKKAGSRYHLKIRIYPHNILRENKIAIGAGADRISDGMRHSFGKPVGTAARVMNRQKIISIRTTSDLLIHAKEALRKAGTKIPVPCKIVIEPT